MRMKDLVELVKAGLKPQEIREMIELEKQVKDINIDEPSSEENGSEKNTVESGTKNNEVVTNNEEITNKSGVENNSDVDKLSGLLENANNEIETLKSQIAELQASNRNRDMSGNSDMSIEDKVTNIISEMY